MAQKSEAGNPKSERRFQQQLGAKDREIAELRKQMDQQGQQLATALSQSENARTLLALYIRQRDEVIALQASLQSRLLGIYQPAIVQWVDQEVVASRARLEAAGAATAVADEAAAQELANRT